MIGNSFFTDSQWLVPDLIDMAKQRLNEALVKNKFVDSAETIETIQELCQLMVKYLNVENQNDYAFVVLGKMDDREGRFIRGGEPELVT